MATKRLEGTASSLYLPVLLWPRWADPVLSVEELAEQLGVPAGPATNKQLKVNKCHYYEYYKQPKATVIYRNSNKLHWNN